MTKEKLNEFINKGGIDKIGHAAFALLSVLVEMAEQKDYPDRLKVSIRGIMFKAKFMGYNQFKVARDILVKEGLIKKYENPTRTQTGTFFLKYDE